MTVSHGGGIRGRKQDLMNRLDGKVALVTGAAKGLGEADARLFSAHGATVILTDVDCENGERVAHEIGSAARFVKHDVCKEDEWETLIKQTVADFGGVHVLVNNAGVVEPGTIETQTAEEFRFVMAVSADGTFFGCKHAVPAMKESGGGSIINMASIASLQGTPVVAAYSAAKGAVEALTRTVAMHCALNKYNIRCNSVHPSSIMTPMVKDIRDRMVEKGMVTPQKLSEATAANKIGEPDDIANTVLFLASDESKFINGAQIRVDNGISVLAGSIPE